jgi:hypothetical protein
LEDLAEQARQLEKAKQDALQADREDANQESQYIEMMRRGNE